MNAHKLLLCCLFFMALSITSYGQRYENSFGLKAGYGYFATYKHHLGEKFAFDAFLGNFESQFTVGTAFHFQYPNSYLNDQLNIYYGVGGAVVFRKSYANYGVLGVGGVEYILESAPISFSLEFMPGILLGENGGFVNLGSGVVFRYIINR